MVHPMHLPALYFKKYVIDYGWLTILVGALAMAATYPGRTHGLGMFTERILSDFQIADPDGRVFYSNLNLWATLLGAFFCIPAGWMLDRFDQRWILFGNMILLGLSVFLMGFAQNCLQLFAGLLLTRGFGQSSLSVVSISVVAKSFPVERIGLAMAWYSILSAPFHLLLIRVVGHFLGFSGYGWRQIWCGIGLSIMFLSLGSFLLSRNQPKKPLETNETENLPGYTLGQALKTMAFWTFGLTISIWGMISSGVSLFNVDIFKERGFAENVYFDVLSLITMVALFSKLFFGFMVRFLSLTKLLAICLFFTAIALAALPYSNKYWHAMAYGLTMGISSGAVALIFFASWSKLFGKKNLGRIQGVAQMLTVFASACGPLIFSMTKKLTSSYSPVFVFLACLVFLMACVAWLTPIPKSLENMEHSET